MGACGVARLEDEGPAALVAAVKHRAGLQLAGVVGADAGARHRGLAAPLRQVAPLQPRRRGGEAAALWNLGMGCAFGQRSASEQRSSTQQSRAAVQGNGCCTLDRWLVSCGYGHTAAALEGPRRRWLDERCCCCIAPSVFVRPHVGGLAG